MHSENEDDPGSSSEWKEDDKKKVKRRRSNRKTKKIRFSLDYSSNDDSDQDWNHTRKGKGSAKRKINNGPVEVDSSYTSGSFLISKLDMQNFDQLNPPHIWRIDGKFLLQKFEPFIEDKKLKYRNTSIVSKAFKIVIVKYCNIVTVHRMVSRREM